ncbi:MAG: autotransporter-associated beta strand repeat-containing protein [Chthoniobacterales bacterium]|nr:autotransporter-associated beta strand repeat-containing protein [Chthoniobacterales bacterium]
MTQLNTANGSISNSSSITIIGTGTKLLLDNSVNNNNDRIGNNVTLSYGGELSLTGNGATSSTNEAFGTLGIAGGTSTISVTGTGASQTQILAGTGSSRTNNATALVRGTSLGDASTNSSRITLSSLTGLTQIGTATSSGGAGTTKNLTIVPYLMGDTSGTGVGKNFVTYDTTRGLRPLDSAEQSLVTAGATGDNVKSAAGANAVTGAKTFNSLLLGAGAANTPATTASTVTGDGSSLTLTSGALANVATGASGSSTITGFGSIIFGTTGANEAIVTNENATAGGTLTIDSPVDTFAAGGGLTKTGAGLVVLSQNNLYTGQTTVNQGTLQFGNGGSTGGLAAGNTANIALNGGSLAFNRSNDLAVSNSITGVGSLTKSGAGKLTLSGTDTYSGTTTISASGGTLAVDSGSAGTGKLANTSAITVNSGGTLLLAQSGTASNDRINNAAAIGLAGGTLASTNSAKEGVAATRTGGILSGTSTVGLGALTLTASSTLDFDSASNGNLLAFTSFTPAGFVLNITNYSNANFNGTTNSGLSTDDRLIFSQSQALNLGQFNFVGTGMTAQQILLDNGFYEVGINFTPVPEPSTWAAALLSVGVIGWSQRKKVESLKAKVKSKMA